jgi:hypothetical protein
MVEIARGLDTVLMAVPRGVTRCLLEEGLRAGESGKNLGLDVRMNVYQSASIFTGMENTYIWVLVVYATQRTGEK